VALAAPIRGQIRGTLRVPEGVDAVAVLGSVSDNLAAWGGHRYAAGFSVLPEKWEELQRELEKILSSVEIQEQSVSALELSPKEIGLSAWQTVTRLGPFGHSNPYPFFYCDRTGNERALPLGKNGNHVQMEIDGIWLLAFNGADTFSQNTDYAGLVYHPRLDYWQGEERIQYILDYLVYND
jgi:single-stranded-DNA-specific exonuclease